MSKTPSEIWQQAIDVIEVLRKELVAQHPNERTGYISGKYDGLRAAEVALKAGNATGIADSEALKGLIAPRETGVWVDTDPLPELQPADKNKDGVVSNKERKQAEREGNG